jgi:hypothetical protein
MQSLNRYEKTRKVGPKKENRRKVAKTLYDLNFLCNYITNLLMDEGKMETDITLASVDRMFSHVAHHFVSGKCRIGFFNLFHI